VYIKVKPGTLIKDIEDILEKNNQELSFEPTDFGYLKMENQIKEQPADVFLAILQAQEDLK